MLARPLEEAPTVRKRDFAVARAKDDPRLVRVVLGHGVAEIGHGRTYVRIRDSSRQEWERRQRVVPDAGTAGCRASEHSTSPSPLVFVDMAALPKTGPKDQGGPSAFRADRPHRDRVAGTAGALLSLPEVAMFTQGDAGKRASVGLS